MNVLPTLKTAMRALARNKLRSFLTMLGIVIGVGAVVAMVAIGQGAKASIQSAIEKMGANMMILLPGSSSAGGIRWGDSSVTTLTPEDAAAIQRECPAVAAVSPHVRFSAQVVNGDRNWSTTIEGASPEWEEIRSWPAASGAYFTAQDVRGATKVCLLGKTVVKWVFGEEDPVGRMVRIRGLPFKVLGVLAEKGQSTWGQDLDNTVLVPYTTGQKKFLGITHIQRVYLSAASTAAMPEAEAQIRSLLRQRHKLQPRDDDDFTVRNQVEMNSAMQETSDTMTGLLASIAAVSLVVGGIGIMNIMLVSVTERTREIGLRMAVGATGGNILLQFLIEAATLSLLGGVIGLGVGVAASELIAIEKGWPILISIPSMVLSYFFAAAVGLFFGFYPAHLASRLDPVEALRYE